MATPVGHMLAGATASLASGRRDPVLRQLALGALAGAMPDLDFLPGLVVGDPATFHHGPSHSLAFALLAGAIVWILVRRNRWKWALTCGTAYASHLLLDTLTRDPSFPVGIQLFWPVSEAYIASPLRPLPRVLHGVSVINAHNFRVALVELLLFGGLLWGSLHFSSERAEHGGS